MDTCSNGFTRIILALSAEGSATKEIATLKRQLQQEKTGHEETTGKLKRTEGKLDETRQQVLSLTGQLQQEKTGREETTGKLDESGQRISDLRGQLQWEQAGHQKAKKTAHEMCKTVVGMSGCPRSQNDRSLWSNCKCSCFSRLLVQRSRP